MDSYIIKACIQMLHSLLKKERRWLTLRKSTRRITIRSYRCCNYRKAGLLHYPECQNCIVRFRGSILTLVSVSVTARSAIQQAGYYGQRHPMSSKGTLPQNLKLFFSILIGRNQEQVAKSNLIFTLRATQL